MQLLFVTDEDARHFSTPNANGILVRCNSIENAHDDDQSEDEEESDIVKPLTLVDMQILPAPAPTPAIDRRNVVATTNNVFVHPGPSGPNEIRETPPLPYRITPSYRSYHTNQV